MPFESLARSADSSVEELQAVDVVVSEVHLPVEEKV